MTVAEYTTRTARAVLYARTSKSDDREDGRNLAGQLDMCREYAQSHGYNVVTEFSEDGESGASIHLPQLDKVRDMAAAGLFDILIVRELDRLSRDLAKQLIVEQELKRNDVSIAYVLGDYADTLEGQLSKNVRAVIAEYERQKINERMKRARTNKVKAGSVIVNGRPPYGYELVYTEATNWNELRPIESEARIVHLIFDWYTAGGMAMRKIAEELTARGIPAPHTRREHLHGSEPSKWWLATIQRILKNETYAGVWHYGKRKRHEDGRHSYRDKDKWLSVDVPPIIDREQWERAQQLRAGNAKRSRRNTQRKYLLRTRVKCGKCGAPMYGQYKTKKKTGGREYQYYQCAVQARPYNFAGRSCNVRLFRADKVDAAVWGALRDVFSRPEELQNGLIEHNASLEARSEPLKAELATIYGVLEEQQQQLAKLLDLYLAGTFGRDIVEERRAIIERTIADLEAEAERLELQINADMLTEEELETLCEFSEHIAEALDTADISHDMRRLLVDTLDVNTRLVREDGREFAYVECYLGDMALGIESLNIRDR